MNSENKVEIRPVKVGERVGTEWIIEDGVKPGESRRRRTSEGAGRHDRQPQAAHRQSAQVNADAAEVGREVNVMAKFFINRPIVAMVISIVMVIVGVVAMVQLPIAQYPPNSRRRKSWSRRPMSAPTRKPSNSRLPRRSSSKCKGVDNMIYMYSVNDRPGLMRLRVTFDVGTDPNTDQILSQMRYSLAESQLASGCAQLWRIDQEVALRPVGGFLSLLPPNGTYDDTFLSNYAYININDP